MPVIYVPARSPLPRRLHVRTTKFPRISQFSFLLLLLLLVAAVLAPRSNSRSFPFSAISLFNPPSRRRRRRCSLCSRARFRALRAALCSSSLAVAVAVLCELGGNWIQSVLMMNMNEAHRNRRSEHGDERANGVKFGSDDDEHDPWTAWAYKPRTITLLLLGACLLIWASGALDPESTASNDRITSVKRGIWAMISVFLAYCLLQAPSTVLIRPHPAIWRLVHGMAVTYLVVLTFLLFQNRDDARQFMKFLHPDLGIELPERSYGADCRVYVPENPKNRFINVYETLFDEFVLAHVLGWWGKAIMIRNQPLLWVLSIGFELMELTFRHMLPNFNECWWDSIILDILICNWFGIWAGMRTVRYFDGRTYEWVGISRQPSIIGKVKRTLSQFTPAQWDKDQWHPLLGPWRFIQVLSLCIVFMTVELNTFFLKFCLWIPPRNPLIIYRLILWWLIAIPTIREYNNYLQDSKPVKKVGAFCWLSLAICIVELLICIKFGQGLFPNRMPRWLITFWASAGASLVIFLVAWTWHNHRTLRKKIL